MGRSWPRPRKAEVPKGDRRDKPTTRLCGHYTVIMIEGHGPTPHPRVTFGTCLSALKRNVGGSPTARISGPGQTASIRSRWPETNITRVPPAHLWLVVHSWPVGLQAFEPQDPAYAISACVFHPRRPTPPAPPLPRGSHPGRVTPCSPRPDPWPRRLCARMSRAATLSGGSAAAGGRRARGARARRGAAFARA